MDEISKRYLEFCEPFVRALREVYEKMMGAKLASSGTFIKKDCISYGDFSSIMGISGTREIDGNARPYKGSLVISWPRVSYLKMASKMLMDEYKEYCDEIADVGMEICNITMGNAKKDLKELGYTFEMSIPTSVRGQGLEINAQKGVVSVVAEFQSELGNLRLELNYEEDKN